MRFLVRVLLIFFVVTAVLSIIRGALSPSTTPRRRPAPGPGTGSGTAGTANSEHLVKDPVCGTYVPENTAIRSENNFFCSEECKTKYLAG
jgi:hypothetical protein